MTTQAAQTDQPSLAQQSPTDPLKSFQELYTVYADALKVVGAGNAAGAVAAGAALNSFSSKPIFIIAAIKLGGAIFMAGVFCFAVGFALTFVMYTTVARIPDLQRQGETGREQLKYAHKCIDRAVASAKWGIRFFFLGWFVALLTLLAV